MTAERGLASSSVFAPCMCALGSIHTLSVMRWIVTHSSCHNAPETASQEQGVTLRAHDQHAHVCASWPQGRIGKHACVRFGESRAWPWNVIACRRQCRDGRPWPCELIRRHACVCLRFLTMCAIEGGGVSYRSRDCAMKAWRGLKSAFATYICMLESIHTIAVSCRRQRHDSKARHCKRTINTVCA